MYFHYGLVPACAAVLAIVGFLKAAVPNQEATPLSDVV